MLEPETCYKDDSQASFCPRRKKRPREGSHACGVTGGAGQCFFWYFSLRQRKVHIKKRISLIKNKTKRNTGK
jgi:hypothetical protein